MYGFRRRFRRRPSFGRRVAMARPLVRAATTSKHVYRYHNIDAGVSLAAGRTSIPLLVSSDDPDYEVGGDFATACQCEEGAFITGINLNINIQHAVAGTAFELLLTKDSNGILEGASIVPSNLFSNNPTANVQLLRKMALAYKAFHIPTDSLERNIFLRVKRTALKRIGQIHEDDTLRLILFNGHASTAGSLQGYGKIYIAEN